jgi:hypothetical protein
LVGRQGEGTQTDVVDRFHVGTLMYGLMWNPYCLAQAERPLNHY